MYKISKVQLQTLLRIRTAVLVAATLPALVQAQSSTPDREEIDNVIIYGQRQALSRALEQYRDADAVSNFISADDMGKFVDQNVAESLQRVPGVSISRDQGEGRFVSVRGLAPGLNTVTINGTRIGTPEDGSRAVPLDVIPAASVSEISVVKAPTPDMPADMLGGAVDIKSASPFDLADSRFNVRAESSYNELSGESSPKLSLNYTGKLSETVGVSAGLNYLDREFESDNIEAEYDELEFGSEDVFAMIETQQRKYYVNRERLGANVNLEFRPSDTSRYFANTVYSEFTDAEVRQRSIFVFEDGDISAFNGQQVNITDMPEDSFRRRIRFRTKEQDTLAFSAGGEHEQESWNVSYRAGLSTTRERVLDENEGRYEYDVGPLDATYSFGSGIPSFSILNGGVADTTHLDNSNYVLDRAVLEPKVIDDDEMNIGADIEFPGVFFDGNLTVKAGFDMRWKEKDVDTAEVELRDVPNARLDALTASAPDYGLGNLGQGISASRYISFFNSERSNFQIRPQDEVESIELQIANDFVADEDVLAVYVMGTMELGRTQIIAGVRMEQTDYSATGNRLQFNIDDTLEVTPRSVSSDYTSVLPGLHVKHKLGDDTVLRAAWTNTIARPSFSDISPRASVNVEDEEVDLGNPDLDPYEAMNLDVVLDWYYANGSVLSVGAFYKDIDNYVVEVTSNNVAEFAGYDVTRPTNSTQASILGLEANAQHSISDGLFNGLLFGANVTLMDTELELSERSGENFELPEAAERTANIFIGYERNRLSTRLSWTFRDEFLNEVGDDSRYDIYVAAHHQLDLTASFLVTDAIKITAELSNINDEALELYQGSDAFTFQFEEYGRTFALGLEGRF